MDNDNFAPRVGLAYALDAKTSLRAGAGIFYTLSRATVSGHTAFRRRRRIGAERGGFLVQRAAGQVGEAVLPWLDDADALYLGQDAGRRFQRLERPNLNGDPATSGSVRDRFNNWFNVAASG